MSNIVINRWVTKFELIFELRPINRNYSTFLRKIGKISNFVWKNENFRWWSKFKNRILDIFNLTYFNLGQIRNFSNSIFDLNPRPKFSLFDAKFGIWQIFRQNVGKFSFIENAWKLIFLFLLLRLSSPVIVNVESPKAVLFSSLITRQNRQTGYILSLRLN